VLFVQRNTDKNYRKKLYKSALKLLNDKDGVNTYEYNISILIFTNNNYHYHPLKLVLTI